MLIEIRSGVVDGRTLRSFHVRYSEEEFRKFAARLDPDKPIPADPMTRALHAEMVHAIGDNRAAAVMRRQA